MSDTADQVGPLKPAQLRRVAALNAARTAIGGRNVLGSNGVDAMPLVDVARYIITGDDPFARTES